MKKLCLIFALIAIFTACIGASYTAIAEENNGYVYYAKDVDGVLTAYSVAPLSENAADVTVTKTTPTQVKTLYAVDIQYKNDASGRVYVEIKNNSEGEKLRAVKIDGNNLESINATFTEGVVSFYVDTAGTYAIIDVTDAVAGGFSWYHIALIAGVVLAIVACVISVVRSVKR